MQPAQLQASLPTRGFITGHNTGTNVNPSPNYIVAEVAKEVEVAATIVATTAPPQRFALAA